MVEYIAGPMYKPVGEDKRKPGDIIEEANDWPDRIVASLLRFRVIEVSPRGKWLYIAGPRYRGAEKPGEQVDISEVSDNVVSAMIRFGEIQKVDSADLEKPKKRGRPPRTRL